MLTKQKNAVVQEFPSLSGEEEDEEEADGSSKSAHELNKGMVPLADLFNAGTSKARSDPFLIVSETEFQDMY